MLEVSRFQVHRLGAIEPVHAALMKAERATPQHTLEQLTEPALSEERRGRARFKESKPMLTRVTGAQAAAVLASLGPYRQMLEPQRQHLLSFYRPVDVAFKVVGTGSVGLRDYCIYFEGNGPGDPLFLQIKEEVAIGLRAVSARCASGAPQRPARGRGAAGDADAVGSVSGLDAHRRPAISGAAAQRSQGIDRAGRPGRRRT